MGQFSWLDCNDRKNAIIDDYSKTSYVLVPNEFTDTYGKFIAEECYDGYGRFGGYDIYDLVADWNKEYLSKNLITKCGENWLPENMFEDFLNGSLDESQMKDKYGEDYKRLIGIYIACYDKDNMNLKYPIKVSYSNKWSYEECGYSPSDPNQGWLEEDFYDDYDEDDENEEW